MSSGLFIVVMLMVAQGDGPASRGRLSPASKREAASLYAKACASCHGDAGRGDGPVAKHLPIRLADMGDPSWQAGNSDAAISKIVVKGGLAVGRSAAMPPTPELESRPDVLRALVVRLRTFARR